MRFLRTLMVGLVGLAALFLVTIYSAYAVIGFAAAILVLVTTGFLIPVPRWVSCVGSALEKDWMDGSAQSGPFPRIVVFQSEIRNRWLLLFSPLFALWIGGAMIAALKKPGGMDVGAEAILMATTPSLPQWVALAALFFAWSWFRERLLLQKAEVGIGFWTGPAALGRRTGYQYFDADGERRGGNCYVWGHVTTSFPVFMRENNPDFSKPGFGFLFHKFAVMEAKAVPSPVLAEAQKRIALRLRSARAAGTA